MVFTGVGCFFKMTSDSSSESLSIYLLTRFEAADLGTSTSCVGSSGVISGSLLFRVCPRFDLAGLDFLGERDFLVGVALAGLASSPDLDPFRMFFGGVVDLRVTLPFLDELLYADFPKNLVISLI